MEKYHIYEEIGKGEFSQVFKGREKKKIEFVAIKRIEKAMMPKVVSEVQILHKLTNNHILKFHDWYETRNNLWLILEYCTGSDLESILRADGHLPETSVRLFGLDVIAALKYLHSVGIIHNDLRARNFLVDEYGILKLSDFKYSTKVPKETLGDSPLAQRGVPANMAPELFTSEGVMSYSSDMWSLGVLLYQLRRGILPFGDTSYVPFDQLQENIRSISDPIQHPVYPPANMMPANYSTKSVALLPSISLELADLMLWLLEKAPMNRCSWNELCSHPFWKPNVFNPPSSLPPQPAYEALVRELERSRSEQIEQASIAEFNLSPETIDAYNQSMIVGNQSILHTSHVHNTPLKLPPAADSTPMRPDAARGNRRRGGATETPTTGEINARIQEAFATHNRVDQNQKTPSRNPAQASEDEETPRRGLKPSMPAPLPMNLPAPPTPAPSEAVDYRGVGTPVSAIKSTATNNFGNRSPPPPSPPKELFPFSGFDHSISSSPTIASQLYPEKVLLHPSDAQVKPIVGNKAIETIESIDFIENNLPFEALLGADRLSALSQSDLEVHLTQVYKALHKAAVTAQSATPTNAYNSNSVPISSTVVHALADRVNILAYLSHISYSSEVANVVLNTHFLQLLLRLMKAPTINYTTGTNTAGRSPGSNNASSNQQTMHVNQSMMLQFQCKYICATVLSLMLRYATFISPPGNSTKARDEHVIPVTLYCLKDLLNNGSTTGNIAKNAAINAASWTTIQQFESKAKKRLVAALGEMMFYISSQDEEDSQGANEEGGESGKWIIPSQAVELLTRCLQENQDEVIRHYAAKTVENIFAQGGISYKKKLVQYDLASALMEMSQNSILGTNNEHLQATSAMAIVHIFHFVLMSPQMNAYLSSSTGTASPTKRSTTAAASSKASTPPLDPFAAPLFTSSAKFVSKLCEQINVGYVVEMLKDGPLKLQQAYLTLMNMLFLAPFTNADSYSMLLALEKWKKRGNAEAENIANLLLKNASSFSLDGNQIQQIYTMLNPIRSAFLRSHTVLLPSLLRLLDGGSHSNSSNSGLVVIRGKAMLAIQALCLHMPILIYQLPERRLSTLLLRILEPYLTSLPTGGAQTPTNAAASALTTPSYMMRLAFSLLIFLRNLGHKTLYELAQHLTELANISAEHIPSMLSNDGVVTNNASTANGSNSPVKKGTITKSPSKPGSRFASPSPTKPVAQKATPSSNSNILSFAPQQCKSVSEMLRGLISLLSQPSLFRMIFCREENALLLSQILQALPIARAAIVSYPKKTIFEELKESVLLAEQSCLTCFEAISQVEIPENEISPNSEGNSEEGEEITTQHYMLQQILRINYPSFIQHSIQLLLPRACQLLTHPDNDLRTVVLSSLRHSLAYYLSLYLLLIGRSSDSNGDGNGEDVPTAHIPVVQQLLQSIFTQMASLLQEEIPMPQYAIRLLVSLFSVAYTSPNAHQIKLADLLMSNLRSYGLVPILMEVLKVTSTTAMTNSNSISASGVAEQSSQVLGNMLDPQLLQLIRSVCEFHSKSSEDSQASISGVLLLIESEVAQSLSIATISTVYAYISYPYHSSSLPTSGSVGVALSASSSTAEVISLLLDVTYFVLHFVLKSLSDNSNNNHQMVNGAGAPVTRHIFSQQLRKAITAMQSISPALLMVMGYCEHLLASYPGSVASPPSNVDAEDTTTIAMATQWLDMSGRCLGMLFDIFPDILSSQLLSKQSVCLQQPQATPSSNTAIPQLPPRVILSKVLRNRRIDQKIQLKIVKILFGITKMSISNNGNNNNNASEKLKEALLSEPLFSALSVLSRTAASSGSVASQSEMLLTMKQLASQMLEIAQQI